METTEVEFKVGDRVDFVDREEVLNGATEDRIIFINSRQYFVIDSISVECSYISFEGFDRNFIYRPGRFKHYKIQKKVTLGDLI